MPQEGGFMFKLFSGNSSSKSESKRGGGVPRVQTGPNRGQERSRNDDGAWRRKRSDAGKSRK